MKKIGLLGALMALLMSALPTAAAGPTEGGVASDDVEYVRFVPFEVGTATGIKVVGKYMYLTSWKSFSIYDVSDPEDPELLSTVPFGFKFENEDVATNGKILIFSEQLPLSAVHIWDVEDKSNPQQIATLSGSGAHTMSCILKCRYLYGSNGKVIDLRDPANPKEVGNFLEGMPASGTHDVEEVSPGIVLTSSRPIMVLDARKDPVKPKLVAVGDDDRITGGVHSNKWPRKGKDRFAMFANETNARTRCGDNVGGFSTWDTTGWKKTGQLRLIETYRVSNGTGLDGSPPVNGLGCSAHWFEAHATFKNGGLITGAFYEHGTRFLDISSKGKIEEVGYFMPWGGSTSASYWVTKELVYAIDYSRGIDILRWTGDV